MFRHFKVFTSGRLITVRNEVTKVMFLHLSVILFTVAGGLPQCMLGYQPPGTRHPPRTSHPPGAADTPPMIRHPLGADPPEPGTPLDQAPPSESRHPPGPGIPPADGYCCGRYASYWNAFLFDSIFAHFCRGKEIALGNCKMEFK